MTYQAVRVRVVNSTSGKEVSGVRVSLKVNFEAAHPLSRETLSPPKEWHQHKREFWEQSPWFEAATEKNGETDVAVVLRAIDRTSGPEPPSWRDVVTGLPFFVRIENRGSPDETVNILMRPGATATGKFYRLTVLKIEPPKYRD
jgi:hypothetical protein